MLSNSNSNMVAPPKTSYYKGLGDNWEQQNAGGEESPEFFYNLQHNNSSSSDINGGK